MGAIVRDRRPTLALALVFGLALVVRLLYLRGDSTFQRTDEVMFLLNAMKLHGLFSSPAEAVRELFWLFAFPWGYPVVVVLWSLVELYGLVGIPVNEVTAVVPFAVVGALGPILVFALGRRLASPAVGLAAAVALAVFPSHVAQSRTIAAWILASNLMMLALLAFLRYAQTGRRRDAWLFSLALAAYLPSDNLMPGTLLMVGALALVQAEGGLAARLGAAWRLSWRWEVLLVPALAVLPLLVVHAVFVATGRATYGFVGHYFLGKTSPGAHPDVLVRTLASNAGPALALLLALGAIQAGVSLVRRERAMVFGVWVLSFAVPSVFMIDPKATLVEAYVTPVVIPLLVLGCVGLQNVAVGLRDRGIAAGPALAVAGFLAIVGWTLASIPARIYDRDFAGLRRDPIGLWGGEIYPNNGAKTAGYWIRTNAPPGTVVLSDLRLFVGKYYFHHPTIPPSDPRFAPAEFQRLRPHVGFVAITAAFTEHARAVGYLDGYHRVLVVTHRSLPVFYVYAREPRSPEVLRAEEIDARFDREFGRVAMLRYPFVWEDDLPRSSSTATVRPAALPSP